VSSTISLQQNVNELLDTLSFDGPAYFSTENIAPSVFKLIKATNELYRNVQTSPDTYTPNTALDRSLSLLPHIKKKYNVKFFDSQKEWRFSIWKAIRAIRSLILRTNFIDLKGEEEPTFSRKKLPTTIDENGLFKHFKNAIALERSLYENPTDERTHRNLKSSIGCSSYIDMHEETPAAHQNGHMMITLAHGDTYTEIRTYPGKPYFELTPRKHLPERYFTVESVLERLSRLYFRILNDKEVSAIEKQTFEVEREIFEIYICPFSISTKEAAETELLSLAIAEEKIACKPWMSANSNQYYITSREKNCCKTIGPLFWLPLTKNTLASLISAPSSSLLLPNDYDTKIEETKIKFLEELKHSSSIDWTVINNAIPIVPVERSKTGYDALYSAIIRLTYDHATTDRYHIRLTCADLETWYVFFDQTPGKISISKEFEGPYTTFDNAKEFLQKVTQKESPK
jgi:hypothetical protein